MQETQLQAPYSFLRVSSRAHLPALREAGQGEPDAGSDVSGGEDVDGELQGPHVGHGNVQRTLQVDEECYQLWFEGRNQINFCSEPPRAAIFFTALSGFALLDQGYVADLLQSRLVLLALNNTLNSKDNTFFHDTDTMDTLLL